jgi:hypothetical protein
MMSRVRTVWIVGFVSTWLGAQSATAALWSIKADCEEGDWSVEIELAGFGALDASCLDGTKTELSVDVGELGVTNASVAATSTSGTMCDGATRGEPRFKLECSQKTEDAAGFELEEELEVEMELELHDGREETEQEDEVERE